MDTILELNKFSHIKYYDEPHKYYAGNREFTSATTFIGKFKNKFDTENMAQTYADKRGLVVEDVINEWDLKRDISTVKGSMVHNYAENFWYNKVFPYDPSVSIKKFGTDIIKDKFEKCVTIFEKFYNDAKTNLIPVKMEFVVADEDYGIAGMVENFKSPISHIDVCEINTYSLQLHLYKHIIEKNTNLKIGNLYLVWINEVNDNYKIFPCKDLTAELKLMLETTKK